MKKCGFLTMERGKVVGYEGMKLQNSKVMNVTEKEGYTYLGIVELDKIKENKMKEKIIKEYKRRLQLGKTPKVNTKWEKQTISNK